MMRALTIRIALSVLLFVCIMVALAARLDSSHRLAARPLTKRASAALAPQSQ